MAKKETNRIMSGVEYYRRKKRVKVAEIQQLFGGSPSSCWRNPNKLLNMSCVPSLIAVADRLGVTVDQLFEIHSTAQLDDGDHPQRESKRGANSALGNYRAANGLTFEQLAGRLGVSRQCAQEMCAQAKTKAGIRHISKYEGMSPEEFLEKYAAVQAGDLNDA